MSKYIEMFLKSESIYKKAYQYPLNKLEKYANRDRKDTRELYEITENELREYAIEAFSEHSDSTKNSYMTGVRKYFEWIELNNIYKFKYDYSARIKEFTRELLDNHIYSTFSRKEIYYIAYSYYEENPMYGIIILLLFEGVRGEKYKDIMNMKKTDLKGSKLTINNKKHIEVPEDFIRMYKKAASIKSIIRKGKGNKKVEIALYDNEYLIRNHRDSDFIDRNNSYAIYNRFKILRNRYGKINEDIVERSGICFYLSLIEQNNGSGYELRNEDYRKVMLRFYDSAGINYNKIKNVRKIYAQYRKSEKMTKIDFSSYFNVYSDIVRTEDEEETHDRADKELGCYGEKYIYTLLVNKYGINNVYDETKNGVGYDFSVNNEGKKLYEVKSTGRKEKEIFQFYMTIKEIKSALINKENFKLCIVYFNNKLPINLYVIENPIEKLDFINEVNKVVDMYDEDIFVPVQVKIKIEFDKIKMYKNKKL